MTFPLVYAWGNNSKRAMLKGRRCRLIARGSMNSILIEFENGERVVTSRYAVRPAAQTPSAQLYILAP